jgi:hypothetical protein
VLVPSDGTESATRTALAVRSDSDARWSVDIDDVHPQEYVHIFVAFPKPAEGPDPLAETDRHKLLHVRVVK